jgi:hypothetical protein
VETAWFAGDDPAPFAAMARAWLGRSLAKGAYRLRAARPSTTTGPTTDNNPDSRNETAPCTTWQ